MHSDNDNAVLREASRLLPILGVVRPDGGVVLSTPLPKPQGADPPEPSEEPS